MLEHFANWWIVKDVSSNFINNTSLFWISNKYFFMYNKIWCISVFDIQIVNGKKYLYEPTFTAAFYHNSLGWYNLHYYYYFIISLFNSLFNLIIFFIPPIIYQLNVSSYLYKFHFFFYCYKKPVFIFSLKTLSGSRYYLSFTTFLLAAFMRREQLKELCQHLILYDLS